MCTEVVCNKVVYISVQELPELVCSAVFTVLLTLPLARSAVVVLCSWWGKVQLHNDQVYSTVPRNKME